uniref:NADH dehydrogenase subunit 3 n=1 Tax=Leofa pulchella TaxID=1671235 RepID=UPI002434E144|nr:NADH dehydrogenase subunit 3 [Leofa pulchella]WEU77775.1 NADH dehydrogenase subunit 3 [Leofa pulchella]
MLLTMYSLLTILLLSSIIVMLILLVMKKTILDTQKSTPFECGFNPMSYARLPFSLHFFMIAVIFLIFDVEIILIMPMIITLKSSMVLYWMLTSIMFTIILIGGVFHEWNNGMINWTK